MRFTGRTCAAAGAALVGAGVIAVTPPAALSPDVHAPEFRLTADEQNLDIVLDLVRHAQTNPDASVIAEATNGLPGFPLSDLGEQQAQEVGQQLVDDLGPNVAGIFGGYEQRMIETATPFLTDQGLTTADFQPLYGFNEVSGGIFTDAVPSSPGEILSELTLAAWAFGLRFVPAPGSNAFNGMVFEEQVNNAINTVYAENLTDPVQSANGQVTDVIFSGGAMITAWSLMNAKNPDVAIFLPVLFSTLSSGNENDFIANASITQLTGNPEDGWTLVSFEGQPMPEYPGLLSDLIVDVRDVITPPQMAAWDIFEAAFTGVSTNIGGAPVEVTLTTVPDALEAGAKSVAEALVQFPGAVINSFSEAVQQFSAALATGATFQDAFDTVIIGLPS